MRQDIWQWNDRNDRETASTSRKEEDTLRRRRANPGTGYCQDSSWDVYQTSENERPDTVEVLAPTKAEEVVP
jgi:hypothetical protein